LPYWRGGYNHRVLGRERHGPDRGAGRIGNPGMDWLDGRQSGEELLLASPTKDQIDASLKINN